jgi:hydroxymethylglutaryl-CoA lyase
VLKNNNIEVVEVGPRDGFQNVSKFIPTEIKLKTIDAAVDSGIKNIQITSFVHPKAIPQMKDAKEITEYCIANYPNINLFALVPNLFGAREAVNSGLKELSYVISVSQTHNLKNVKRTHDESFKELMQIMDSYADVKINLDVATAFGCPFEGSFSLEKIMSFLERAYHAGVRSFNLCDTIGIATPDKIKELIESALKKYLDCEFQIHIHDTRNMGIINTYTAIECGVNKVQTTIGGLGGCPFAPGASGNTSTEDLVYMLNKMGFDTGIDFEKLLIVAKYLKENVSGNYSGHHVEIDPNKVFFQ